MKKNLIASNVATIRRESMLNFGAIRNNVIKYKKYYELRCKAILVRYQLHSVSVLYLIIFTLL